jgi:hypothetical protein
VFLCYFGIDFELRTGRSILCNFCSCFFFCVCCFCTYTVLLCSVCTYIYTQYIYYIQYIFTVSTVYSNVAERASLQESAQNRKRWLPHMHLHHNDPPTLLLAYCFYSILCCVSLLISFYRHRLIFFMRTLLSCTILNLLDLLTKLHFFTQKRTCTFVYLLKNFTYFYLFELIVILLLVLNRSNHILLN